MINKEFKLYLVTKEEAAQLELEDLKFEVKEELKTEKYTVLRLEVNDSEKEDVEVALEFIRSKTKGYGTIHPLDLCIIPSIKINQKIVGFKELIRLHHYYNGFIGQIEFTAEKLGKEYLITYSEEYSTIMNVLTK